MCRRLEINFFFFCRSTLLAPVFRFEHLARFARKKKRHQNGKKGTTKVRRLGGSWGGGGVFAILRKGGWPHPHRTAWGDAHDPARRGKNTKQPKKKKKGRGKRRVLKIKRLEKRALREVVAAAHVARSPISLSYLFCFFSHRTPAATRATRCGGRRCISFPSCFFVKAAPTNSSSVALWRSECRKQGKKSQYVLFFPRHLRRNAGRCRRSAGGFVAFRFRFEVET